MTITPTPIQDLYIIEPRVFEDSRGYFFESYNKKKLADQGITLDFIQDNQSKSSYGVIRGLHYQLNPKAQTKLVRVLEGSIIDVAVDIRKKSPTFGKWFSIELSADNKKQLLVPKGFAHGFSVVSPTAVVMYKCDDTWEPGCEGGIIYNDKTLAIDWQIEPGKEIVSEKDKKLPNFHDAKMNF